MKKILLMAVVAGMTFFTADAQRSPGKSGNASAREHRKDGEHRNHGKKKGHAKKHKQHRKPEAAPIKQEVKPEGKGNETPKKD